MSKEDKILEIKKIIKEKIRPILALHGGNIGFVDYKKNIVKVKLTGACHGCPMAHITLKNSVEATLKNYIPEIIEVQAVKYDLEEN